MADEKLSCWKSANLRPHPDHAQPGQLNMKEATMTAKVTIELQANESGAFSELDLRVLNALAGTSQATMQVGEVKITEPARAEAKAPEAPAEEKPAAPVEEKPAAPVEEKPAAPKRTRRTKAQIEADKAAAEAEEAAKAEAEAKVEAASHSEASPEAEAAADDDDLPVEDPEDAPAEVSMDDVVAKVTALVRGGQQTEVKEALSKFGAARVSKLADKDLPAFFAEISALEA